MLVLGPPLKRPRKCVDDVKTSCGKERKDSSLDSRRSKNGSKTVYFGWFFENFVIPGVTKVFENFVNIYLYIYNMVSFCFFENFVMVSFCREGHLDAKELEEILGETWLSVLSFFPFCFKYVNMAKWVKKKTSFRGSYRIFGVFIFPFAKNFSWVITRYFWPTTIHIYNFLVIVMAKRPVGTIQYDFAMRRTKVFWGLFSTFQQFNIFFSPNRFTCEGFLLLWKGCMLGPHDFTFVSGLVFLPKTLWILWPHDFTLVSHLSPLVSPLSPRS